MVIGIRDNSDVIGQGYVPPPQPEANNEDLRRRCLHVGVLQEKLKLGATRATRSYNHLKQFVDSTFQGMRSSMAEINEPVGNSTITIASLVGGAVIVGFGLLASPAKQNALVTTDLFRNADVLKGLCIAVGAGFMIAGAASHYSASSWRWYKLKWGLAEIRNRRMKYLLSLKEAYDVTEELKQKSTDPRYSEIFFEMFPSDSQLYSIANEMFNMAKTTSDYILENSSFGTGNTRGSVNIRDTEMMKEFIIRIHLDMTKLEEMKNGLPNLHSYTS